MEKRYLWKDSNNVLLTMEEYEGLLACEKELDNNIVKRNKTTYTREDAKKVLSELEYIEYENLLILEASKRRFNERRGR